VKFRDIAKEEGKGTKKFPKSYKRMNRRAKGKARGRDYVSSESSKEQIKGTAFAETLANAYSEHTMRGKRVILDVVWDWEPIRGGLPHLLEKRRSEKKESRKKRGKSIPPAAEQKKGPAGNREMQRTEKLLRGGSRTGGKRMADRGKRKAPESPEGMGGGRRVVQYITSRSRLPKEGKKTGSF